MFGTLLDRGAGGFRFGPFGINVPSGRIYEPGTNTLVTTWKTPTGWVVVRDALTMGPRRGEDTVTPHTRPPADDDADHMLVRTAECIEGTVEIELVCEPVVRLRARARRVDAERRTATAPRRPAPAQTIRLQTDMLLGIEGGRGPGPARPASRRDGSSARSSWAEDAPVPPTRRRGHRAARGDDAVLAQLARRAPASPTTSCGPLIQRSALAIKGLTYMPTGATVAALTTSLPETPGGERNWDYRYTWIRDSTFTLQALHYLNLDWEADEFMQFIADLEPQRRRRRCRSCTASTAAAT